MVTEHVCDSHARRKREDEERREQAELAAKHKQLEEQQQQEVVVPGVGVGRAGELMMPDLIGVCQLKVVMIINRVLDTLVRSRFQTL